MTDAPTTPPPPAPATPVEHAKAAAAAMRALHELARPGLAGNPAEAYDLIDELLPVLDGLWRVCDRLADQFNDWAGLAATHRRASDLPARLQQAASQLGMRTANHACWAHQCMEAALGELDRPRYRTDRGIPLDWTPTQ